MIEQVLKCIRKRKKWKGSSSTKIHYLHMVFNKDEGLPEHFSNPMYT